MNLLGQTKQLCKLYDIHPVRSKGQNFLISEEIYDKIIEVAELKKDDVVLEVGPGLGFLTAKLASKAGRVVAVELDDKLAEVLRTGLKAQGIENVEVVNQNILDLSEAELLEPRSSASDRRHGEEREYKIVANLPYNITSIFLRKFFDEAEVKPELMVLMLQKEVAERITAKPGKMSLLAVSVQFYAGPEIIEYVPKENFWPQPEVDSAIVKLKVNRKFRGPTPKALGVGPLGIGSERDFFRLVKIGFSARRKMLKNNLANGFHVNQETAEKWLTSAGFGQKIRAQELSVEDWKKLFGEVGSNMV